MKSFGVLLILLGLVAIALAAMLREGIADSQFNVIFAVRADDRPMKERIESDLRLQVELADPEVLPAGCPRWVKVSNLINTSKTAAYRVVKPGDGSEVGWREPYVYWTATIDRTDGKPVPVPKMRYGRCGLFAWDWPKDAILLKPGDKLELNTWPMLEFQQAGRVSLRAHYAYRGGKAGPSAMEKGQLGLMADVPSFEIVSDPLVFDVIRPLDVRVKAKRALKADVETRLSDLIEITLVNQSSEPIACSSPTLHADARLQLEIEGEFGGWRPNLSEQRSPYGIRGKLKPGEAAPLLGSGEFANGLDGTWEYPKEGKVKLRAAFMPTTWEGNGSSRILSEWVEVPVEKK